LARGEFQAVDEYRRNAIECLRIADETITARSRVLLIHMAEAWMRLADQAQKNLTPDLRITTKSDFVFTRPRPISNIGCALRQWF
jgi:hypothetical protein